MPRKKTERAKIHAVAYLIGQENASRKEVAARLGISLATVTRAIEEAKEEGWLQITHHFIADNLSPEERREYEQIVSPTIDIQRKINKFVEHNKTTVRPIAHVYNILKRKDESNLTAFTRAIANDIKQLLFQSHVCGVSWGHTLASIVSHLQTPEMRPSRGRERNILFVPVCGESIEDYSYESDGLDAVSIEGQDDMTSSSVLSLQLDRIFNRVMMDEDKPERRRKQLTLRAIPALIPMEFDEDEKERPGEVEVILKFINRIRPYRDIFSKDGWIDQIDTLITSAGSVGGPMSRLKDSFARAGGINPEELHQLKEIVAGDLAGVVFKSEEHDLNPKQEEIFDKLVKRWTGIKFYHIQNCAERAYLHGKPGVIVVAYGEDRAQSVFQGIKNSLINRLFIDEELANELIKLIENRGTRKAI